MLHSAIIIGSLVALLNIQPISIQSTEPVRADVVMSLILERTPDVPVIRNENQFADLPKGHEYETYMLYAERIGIISADIFKNLKPDAKVTRGEFLKMLTLTFGLPVNYPYPYSDVPRGAWYEPYAGSADYYRLFSSESQTQLQPGKIITMQEMARAISILSRKEDPVAIRLEQEVAREQAAGKLQLYTVISTRMQKVALIAQETPDTVVRRIELPTSITDLREEIVLLVNAVRVKNGLKPVMPNKNLESSAQEYADRMSKDGFFGHTDPHGGTLRDRVTATGYHDTSLSPDCMCVKGYTVGENIGRGQKSSVEVMADWMESPSHRAAILNPDYTDIGIGVKSGIWVQHFGGVLTPIK